jgi:hypothetical protein
MLYQFLLNNKYKVIIMGVKLEDADLKEIEALLLSAQKALNDEMIRYNKSIDRLGHSPPNDIPVTHYKNLEEIKQGYAKQITTICSRILKK